MKSIHQRAFAELSTLIPQLTGKGVDNIRPVAGAGSHTRPDFLVEADGLTFVVECKAAGDAAAVSLAARQVGDYVVQATSAAIPLVVVPYMGPVGRKLCAEAGVSWLDMSGNAEIRGPGLHVHVEGRPNRFARRGRPANVFAPRSSRVARQLLLDPRRSFTQKDLVEATGLAKSLVSAAVRRLEQDGLLLRDDPRTVRVRDPDLLLDAWRERYDFFKHQIHRGHVAARSGESLLSDLSAGLGERQFRFAATGLAAAWLLAPFADFRTVSLYVERIPEVSVLRELCFRGQTRGANVWLVVPRDDGVFDGGRPVRGIPCVHPVQVYLDLKGHPERADEAAAHLRTQCLHW